MDCSINGVHLGKYMKIFTPFTKIRIKCNKNLNIRNTLQMLEKSVCDHEVGKALNQLSRSKTIFKK